MFGDILRNVGNFVGGLFGGNKDDEERKRRQQQQSTSQSTVRQPNIGFNPQSAPPTLSNQQDNRPTVQQPVNILQKRDVPQLTYDPDKDPRNRMGKNAQYNVKGFDDNQRGLVQKVIDRGQDPTNYINSVNSAKKSKSEADWLNNPIGQVVETAKAIPGVLVSGAQQGIGMLADTALQGGGVVDYLGRRVRGEDAEKAALTVAHNTEKLRNQLHGIKDMQGNSISGTSGADESAARIVSGNATPGDYLNLGITAGGVGLSGLMVTPGTAGLGIGLRSIGRPVLNTVAQQDMRLISPLSRDILKLPGIRKPGVSQETARVLAGTENSNLPNHDITPAPVEPPAVKPTSDPNSPISAPTRPVPKEPAITSPNRPATPPPVAEPIAPPRVMAESTTPPQILSRPANSNALPPEPLTPAPIPEPIQAQKQAIQKAIEEQKLQAPPENPLPTPATLEMPKQAQARAIAEQSTPINTQAVQASEKAKAVNDAPTEAMKKEAMKYGTAEEFIYEKGLEHPEYKRRVAENEKYINEVLKPARAEANSASRAMQAMEKKYVGKKNLKLTDAEKVKIEAEYKELGDKVRKAQELEDNLPYNYPDEGINREKDLTDLYNQAHAEAKVKTSDPAKSPPTEAMAHPRTLDDVMAEVNKLDDTNPTNAKRLQELSDEFDKLAETKEILPAAPNPTPPSDGELGKVAREAVLDGSITTKEGQAEVIRKTTELANREAEQAGTTIDDIIRKGQETWEKSQLAKHDLSPSEVANGAKTPDGKAIKPVEGFTPEQQSIYQRYSQELSTVRNRTEVALKEGDQGAWYSPRQYLDDMGNAPEYNPELINERKRNNSAKTNSEGNPLDYSTRQHEDYLRRYMTAEDAGAKRLVDAVELHSETGEPTGIKLSDKSKTNLEKGMQKVVEKRDEGLKLQAKGDSRGAEKVARQVQKEIDKTINRLIADIPNGPGRKAAIDQIKVLRGTYMQSTVQTLALSNIVNRVFDQGARAVLGAQRPLTGFIEKRIAPLMNKKVMPGTEAFTLNTSKEARQAAKEMSKGTLKGEIVDNYRANTSMAGAGRNPFAKTIAKIDAHLRASGTALTQAGDISTQVARRTFELGASRPEAQGLKTVADYKKYMADYMNSNNFKTDLSSAESDLMNRIGLSGSAGDNMAHAGKFSRTVSKYLDNGVKTGVEALGQKFGVKGLGDKRIVQEISDYWKVNGPGYAAVTTRVMNYVSNSLALGIPKVIKAVEQAGKGDAAASARATQIAAQSISDAVAAYGTIGASLVLAKIAPDVIGFTGAQPVSGSSDSAYNKSEQIPANQWYINLPGGNRLYIDPSRIGAPGVGANIAGGMQKGTVADTTANTLSQMANQVGGESLIDKYSTVKDAIANPSLSQSQREYAQKRVGSMAAPALGIANNIANLTDDKKRDSAGFTNTLQSRIPGLRQNVPVAKDARGNDIANTKQLSGGSGLLSVGKNTDSKEYQASDPVGAEIARLQKGNKDVFPTNANTNATNKNTQDLAGLLINDKAYKDADDTTKGKMMSSVLNGTDFKNVNTSISNDDKLALIHAKQQGDKKESWLEDNSNAVNYYRADYNNAKANGTLTDKDENLNEKTGKKYLMIGAQVDKDFGADQELKRLYKSIGSGDIKNFFNRKSELYAPEMGDRLLAYDEARTNSGVSRNAKYSDKRKYNSTTAKGGSKGGGGSKGATVNLPSISKSLTGASDGPKFAEGKRLYNPPKALVAPDNKPYAKPPSISVKRGVHL